jgi:hypothetical protein
MVSSIIFFIFLLNAFGLIYVMLDSKSIFSKMATARIARILDRSEHSMIQSPIPFDSETGAHSPVAKTNPGEAEAFQPAAAALTMIPIPAVSLTGACISIEGFKSDIQAQSAKALLASGPLRDKSWVVSTPFPAQYIAGIDTDGLASTRKISHTLAAKGIEPLSMNAKFIVLAKSDSEMAALELAYVSLMGLDGFKPRTTMVSAAGERKTIVTLPQTKVEVQFASTLANRLPGVLLAPVACPPPASALLYTTN